MIYLVVKFNSIDDFNLAHRVFNRLRFWIPPSEEDIKRVLQAPPAGSANNKAMRRKNANSDNKKNEKVNMTAADRVERLELKQALLQQGMLLRYRDWPALDQIVMFFLLAIFMTWWQEVYHFSHPSARLFKIGSLFTGIAAMVSLKALLDLVWKYGSSRTATTIDFRNVVTWLTGIVGAITASSMLLVAKEGGGLMTMTFHLDGVMRVLGKRCFSFCTETIGLSPTSSILKVTNSEGGEAEQFVSLGPTRAFLVGVATTIAVALVPSALTASFAFVHREKLPGRARGNALVRTSVVGEPVLTSLCCLTFFKPLGLGPVQRALATTTAPLPAWILRVGTSYGWLQLQAWMLGLVITLRLVLLRWQLQTYLEYGGILSLYQELHRAGPKPEDVDGLGLRLLFQQRLQRVPRVCLEIIAPLIWLCILLFLLVSKCFLPPFLNIMAEMCMTEEALQAYLSPRGKPLPDSIIAVLQNLRGKGGKEGALDWRAGGDVVHALWDFQWLSESEWGDLLGFFICWTLGAWTVLYFTCIAYRSMHVQMSDH